MIGQFEDLQKEFNGMETLIDDFDGDEDEEESPKCVQLAFVKNDEDTMVARIRMRRANFR